MDVVLGPFLIAKIWAYSQRCFPGDHAWKIQLKLYILSIHFIMEKN